jgi:amino acid transporter
METQQPAAAMRRTLGRFEITCLGINAIVGAGIFALPDDLFREMGGRSPLAFLACALGLLPIAWCYAEASRTTERTGGPYIYVREAFGPVPGYVVGWMCFANSVFAFAAVAHTAAAYVVRVLGVAASEPLTRAIGVVVIVSFCALNALGARPGARVAVAFTIAKLLALLVLLVAAAPAIDPRRFAAPAPAGGSAGQAIFLALFAVQGFEVTPVPAGETQGARRVMPFAILASMLGASLLYVLVQAVVVGAHAGLARPSETSLAEAALAVAPRVGLVVIWGGVVSTLGFTAGNAFGTPRYAYAMALDGYLPRALAWIEPRRGAPLGAIIATGLVSSIMTASFTDGPLFAMSNLAVAVQYLGTCLAVARLPPQPGGTPRALRISIALTGALVSVWILGKGTSLERRISAAALAAGLVLGLINRYYARRTRT